MKTLQANINEALFSNSGINVNHTASNIGLEIWKEHLSVEDWDTGTSIDIEYGLNDQGYVIIIPKKRLYTIHLFINNWDSSVYCPLDLSNLPKNIVIDFENFKADNFKGMFTDSSSTKSAEIYITDAKNIKDFEGLECLKITELEIVGSQIDSFNFLSGSSFTRKLELTLCKCKIHSFNGFPKLSGAVDIRECEIDNISGVSIISQDYITIMSCVLQNGIQNTTIQGRNVNLGGNIKSLNGTTIIAQEYVSIYSNKRDSNSVVNLAGCNVKASHLKLCGFKFENCKALPKLDKYEFFDDEIQSFEGLPQTIKYLVIRDCHVNLKTLDWNTIPIVTECFIWYDNSNTGRNKQKASQNFKDFIINNKCKGHKNIQ
jgi:hypothetical protein